MKMNLLVSAVFALVLSSVSHAEQIEVISKNCNKGKVGNQTYNLKFSKPNSNNEVKIVLDLSKDGRVIMIGEYTSSETEWVKTGKTKIQGGKKSIEVAQVFYGDEKATIVTVGTGPEEDQYDSILCSRR